MAPLSRGIHLLQKGCISCLKPHIFFSLRKRIRFVLCPLPSTVLRASLLISFPAGTKMLQFPAFPLLRSNSGIPGSKAACASPGLIAACHALLQLSSRVIHYTAYAIVAELNYNTNANFSSRSINLHKASLKAFSQKACKPCLQDFQAKLEKTCEKVGHKAQQAFHKYIP